MTCMCSINILASTKYFLDAVKPSRSESKGITLAAENLDSMIDMEEDEAKDYIEDGTNHPVPVNIEDATQKIEKVC